MFSAPRFVVIDDKVEHLKPIVDAFQRLGSPCMGIHYTPETELDEKHFRGVRCLFVDLHLTADTVGSDNKTHYSVIVGILEKMISRIGGPFVLVLWTEYEIYRDELTEYIRESLHEEKPYAHPIKVLGLDKNKFIDAGSGDSVEPEKLLEEVEKVVAGIPQVAAMLEWESNVEAAAGETLASLLDLLPPQAHNGPGYGPELDRVFSLLARESVGKGNVAPDPRTAVNTVLAPILSDRIINQKANTGDSDIWRKAVTRYGEAGLETLTDEEAGRMNRMLHVSVSDTEVLTPADWGAVVDLPFDVNSDEFCKQYGTKSAQILGGDMKVERQSREQCVPVMVRVGAACDYAQNRDGPISYLLGFEVPAGTEYKKDRHGSPLAPSSGIWKSPALLVPGGEEVFNLQVHFRFPATFVRDTCEQWQVRYRVREQLLMQLIDEASHYASRNGIISLRGSS